ncbi:NupC/NupG family nucleoside CNT transporter [Bifidobacterium callimiconis]|uniref:Nucleoside transporter, NupC family n=1 Tax=Bifidobacterium callimiconis TaxID=2306973 RepID=A0A430FCZ1_9BIFI|nr:nucleoside transporter C-terminal domain-containing protein [Bifidobacterium callimiconis]MBT1176813.1 nucleoside transporter [Bifidobacterium callimiconis]RSX50713.1 nucleoside transporter, NupC family [Bifidobacterium callimiconis]
MYLAVNILGLLVFLALGWVFSHDRKSIDWKSVGCMVVLNLVITALLTSFQWGRDAVKAAADGFAWIVNISYKGINFAVANWVGADGTNPAPVNFIVSALLPILLIVPLFDILTYIGFLPWIIKWIGRGLSFITRRPKFETFYAVEMMFLGNTEALAVSKIQLQRMKAGRNVTLAMMSMSCVTAAIIGSYIQMVPGEFVITAIPLNCINALIVSHMLYPVAVTKDEDVIYTLGDPASEDEVQELTEAEQKEQDKAVAEYNALPWYKKIYKHDPSVPKKEPFFSFLGDSILGAGKLILIITANVIAFVALAGLIDAFLGMIWDKLSLESILGVVMYIPAWLMGLDPATAWDFSQLMGLKLVTNEFVVMGQITGEVASYAAHYKAVLTVFITSFANFSTLGMVIGCFKGIVDKEKNDAISKQVGRMLLSGILVSLLSAAMVGLFIW